MLLLWRRRVWIDASLIRRQQGNFNNLYQEPRGDENMFMRVRYMQKVIKKATPLHLIARDVLTQDCFVPWLIHVGMGAPNTVDESDVSDVWPIHIKIIRSSQYSSGGSFISSHLLKSDIKS